MTPDQFTRAKQYQQELQEIEHIETYVVPDNATTTNPQYLDALKQLSRAEYDKLFTGIKKRVRAIISKRKSAIKIAIEEI